MAFLYGESKKSELFFVVYAKVEICLAKGFECMKLSLYRSYIRVAVVANDCTRIRSQRGNPSGEITWNFGRK